MSCENERTESNCFDEILNDDSLDSNDSDLIIPLSFQHFDYSEMIEFLQKYKWKQVHCQINNVGGLNFMV